MGIPPAAMNAVSSDSSKATIQARNSLIGNGFHVPSLCVVLFLLLGLAESSRTCPRPLAQDRWTQFHTATAGTVFEPGVLQHYPGALSAQDICRDMQFMLPDIASPAQ